MKFKHVFRGCMVTFVVAVLVMLTLSTIGFANVVHSVLG